MINSMSFLLKDTLDLPSLRSLLASLQAATGLPASLIDHEGEVLASTGRQEACSLFHRNKDTLSHNCVASDRYFARALEQEQPPGQKYIEHRCQNGLVEVGLPVVFDDMHCATLLIGQFRPDPLDEDFFRQQSAMAGVDAQTYLETIRQMPTFSTESVERLLPIYTGIVEMLANIGKNRLSELRSHNELEKSEKKFRSIVNSSPMGILLYHLNPEEKLILSGTNEAADGILGVDTQKLIGLTIEEAFPGLINTGVPATFRQICREGTNWQSEHIDYDEGEISGAYDVYAFQTSPRTMAVFFSDISERKKSEQALRESEEKYRLLFSAEKDAILIIDQETMRVTEANQAAFKMYGYSIEEFREIDASRLLAEEELEEDDHIRDVIAGHAGPLELYHRRKDGTVFPVEITAGTFEWHQQFMLAVIIRDVSERHRIAKLKDDMLSSISHEMRTPLTAIIGFTELLLQEDVDQENRDKFLGMCYQECERLRELIDDLLDLQRLRAGFTGHHFEPVRIDSILQEVGAIFADTTTTHEILIDCPADLPDVIADPSKIHRALKNLVANAIKYSPAGGTITLSCRQQDNTVSIAISDTGLGIPKEAHDQLFDRFFRVYHPEAKNISGTGLGLALVREIVKMHGGQVRVESAPGKGSTFYLDLPLSGPLVNE
ncbi:MAG: hypothetical protein C0615_01610 [Desulfuromonas sp.]|nr:MAG: hypothetical protein C0615_01610 [Desulfuromonas sp.]